MTRTGPTTAALVVLLASQLGAPAFAAGASPPAASPPAASPAAPPAPGPLVMAPPPTWPTPAELAVDWLVPTAAAVAGMGAMAYVMPAPASGLPANAVLVAGAAAVGVAAPAAALVGMRTRPFATDALLVSFLGTMAGLSVGWLGARALTGGQPDLWTTALAIGVGEGLGTAAAFHAYRVTKPTTPNLDRLPERRTDDPIDDWKFWKERRNP